MKLKPEFFNIEHIINGYTFYESDSDKHNRVYVPRTEDFLEFIDALWKLVPYERRTTYAERNRNMFKRYPWLLVKNRWDVGIDFKDEDGDIKPDWFDYHEGEWLEKKNPLLFFQMQEELKEEFLKNAPDSVYSYTIVDIKEKYWTLRWYDNGNTKKGYEIVNKYCEKFEKEFGWN